MYILNIKKNKTKPLKKALEKITDEIVEIDPSFNFKIS